MQIIALNLNTAIDTFIEPRFTDFLRLCVSFQCRSIKWSINAKETERKFQSFSEYFFSLFSSLLKWQLSRRKKFENIGYWITCALQTSICLPTYSILCIYACKNYCKICMYMCFVSIHIWFRSLHIILHCEPAFESAKKQRLTRLNEMQCTIGQISFAGIQKCFFLSDNDNSKLHRGHLTTTGSNELQFRHFHIVYTANTLNLGRSKLQQQRKVRKCSSESIYLYIDVRDGRERDGWIKWWLDMSFVWQWLSHKFWFNHRQEPMKKRLHWMPCPCPNKRKDNDWKNVIRPMKMKMMTMITIA